MYTQCMCLVDDVNDIVTFDHKTKRHQMWSRTWVFFPPLVFEFFSKDGVWLMEQICGCQQRATCFSHERCNIRTNIAFLPSTVSTGDACRHHWGPAVKPQAPQSALAGSSPGESRTFSQLTCLCRPTVGKVWVHCGQGEACTNPTWAPCWLAHSSFALRSSHQGFLSFFFPEIKLCFKKLKSMKFT